MRGQSIGALGNYRNSGSLPNGKPIVNIGRLISMAGAPTPRSRTPFGQRMFDARMASKLSQIEVCNKLSISQSTLSDAERVANGSSHTPRFAALYGVHARWLATGEGPRPVEAKPPPWPLHRISPEQWENLPDRWRGAIEDAAVAKLRELRGSPPEDVKFSRTAPVDEDAAALVAALQGVPKTAERVGLYARLLNLVDELKATQIARQRRALDPEPTEEPDQTTDMPTGKTRAPL